VADTGLPWELPYPLNTDLVRDGADAIKALAEATADGLDDAGNPGIGSNVVQTVKTDAFSASVAEGAATAITGLTATITPSSDTSRVLVIAQISSGVDTNQIGQFYTLLRGATKLAIGDAVGSRQRVTTGTGGGSGFQADQSLFNGAIFVLDSPGVATAVTYSVEVSHATGATTTVLVNRRKTDNNDNSNARPSSTLTVIEVAP